jgi:hypothetical protein
MHPLLSTMVSDEHRKDLLRQALRTRVAASTRTSRWHSGLPRHSARLARLMTGVLRRPTLLGFRRI